MTRILPKWCKEAKKAMVDKDLDMKSLAIESGFTREYLSAIINGRSYSPYAGMKISKILEIEHIPYTLSI